MRQRAVRRLVASVLVCGVVAASGILFAVEPALALSCAGDSPSISERLDDGPMFVGTVVSTRNDRTWGTFAVEELWSGDVPDEVEVKAGPRRLAARPRTPYRPQDLTCAHRIPHLQVVTD